MNLFDFETFDDNEPNGISSRQIKIRTRIKIENALNTKSLNEFIRTLPDNNESIHYISSGRFNYYNIIPRILDDDETECNELYFSTWTISHYTINDLLRRYDAGQVGIINGLVGDYLQNRDKALFNYLKVEFEKRNQRYNASKNHAKVVLIKKQNKHYVVEGSANFTANPRIEQFVISDSEMLYQFHKNWMDEIINYGSGIKTKNYKPGRTKIPTR